MTDIDYVAEARAWRDEHPDSRSWAWHAIDALLAETDRLRSWRIDPEADSDRLASHPDDPDASFADRLLLALGISPEACAELGEDVAVDAAAIIKAQAHRYPMVVEDWSTERDRREECEDILRKMLDDPGVQFDLDLGIIDVRVDFTDAELLELTEER